MSHVISASTGERREGVKKSIRTYLFYVSPTGKEGGLNLCPHAKRSWSRAIPASSSTDRLSLIEYEVSQPIMVKLWTDLTQFGKHKQSQSIYIEIADTHPEIRVTGYEGFGEFRGNGKVLFTKSGIDAGQLEQHFSYEILKAPLVSTDTGTRSLIFLKKRRK